MQPKRFNRTARIFIGLGVALIATIASCSRHPAETLTGAGWQQENNRPAKLADYKGKVVVLDFYATWCEPCRAETPHLVDLQRLYGDKGLQVIGLNVGGDDDRAEVPKYAKQFGIEYPLAYPNDDLVNQLLSDNQEIPQAFIFGRDGKLVKRFIGFESSGATQLERVIQQALGPNSVATSAAN